jgi:O-methyltransferase involved in polyketide biosynthesis
MIKKARSEKMSELRNISDTAHWVAFYRALESERPDALFRDPFARRLAGERGARITEGNTFANRNRLVLRHAHGARRSLSPATQSQVARTWW